MFAALDLPLLYGVILCYVHLITALLHHSCGGAYYQGENDAVHRSAPQRTCSTWSMNLREFFQVDLSPQIDVAIAKGVRIGIDSLIVQENSTEDQSAS